MLVTRLSKLEPQVAQSNATAFPDWMGPGDGQAASGEYREPRGELLVTAPIMFGKLRVAPFIHAFLGTYPQVTAWLVLSDQVIVLVKTHVDVAVRIGQLPDSQLIARQVGHARWIICASRDYLARRGEPADPSALHDHDCIAFEGTRTGRRLIFGSGASERMVPIRPRLSVNTADAVVEAAAGLGVARLMSYQVATAIADGRLVPILQNWGPPFPGYARASATTGPAAETPGVPGLCRAKIEPCPGEDRGGIRSIATGMSTSRTQAACDSMDRMMLMKSSPQLSLPAMEDPGAMTRQNGVTSAGGRPFAISSSAASATIRRKIAVETGQVASAPCLVASSARNATGSIEVPAGTSRMRSFNRHGDAMKRRAPAGTPANGLSSTTTCGTLPPASFSFQVLGITPSPTPP
jgi:hypothetical protein